MKIIQSPVAFLRPIFLGVPGKPEFSSKNIALQFSYFESYSSKRAIV